MSAIIVTPNYPTRVAAPQQHREFVSQYLDYDQAKGRFRWKYRDWPSLSNRPWANKIWNAKFAGKYAGRVGSGGYRVIVIMGASWREHRLVWLFEHGEFAPDDIDHINHDRTDNRIGNLRLADAAENAKNRKLYTGNKSGFVGVRFDNTRGKWIALIGVSGRRINLGRFNDFEDAVAARKAANDRFGYHPNHGKG